MLLIGHALGEHVRAGIAVPGDEVEAFAISAAPIEKSATAIARTVSTIIPLIVAYGRPADNLLLTSPIQS